MLLSSALSPHGKYRSRQVHRRRALPGAGGRRSSTPTSWSARLQAPGQPALAHIAARFGPELIAADGTLDRAALRAKVLADPRRWPTSTASCIPRCTGGGTSCWRRRAPGATASWSATSRCSSRPPTRREFDAVVLVDAPEAVRRARLLASRRSAAGESRPPDGGAAALRPRSGRGATT